MKKISLFILSFFAFAVVFGNKLIEPANPSAESIMIPLLKSGYTVSLAKFIKLTPAEYKEITGQKLKLDGKISLKILQGYMKKAVHKDGTVNMEKFKKMASDGDGFHLGWFALGFFLGIIGLIIALVINDEKRHGRIKWTLIGFLVSAVLGLIFLLV